MMPTRPFQISNDQFNGDLLFKSPFEITIDILYQINQITYEYDSKEMDGEQINV
jgi:hypothetical protein